MLVLLLHFSLAVSRLSDQTKVLAQRLGMVEQRLGDTERRERRPVREQPAGFEEETDLLERSAPH